MNERDNIEDRELEALRDLAADLLVMTLFQLDQSVIDGTLQEICHVNQS